jgi:hypothetical protein
VNEEARFMRQAQEPTFLWQVPIDEACFYSCPDDKFSSGRPGERRPRLGSLYLGGHLLPGD